MPLTPVPMVEDLKHVGILLLGGKSRGGESWLMLDLALALSTGRPGGGHFAGSGPQPVLCLALEHGQARVQRRLPPHEPDIEAADNLHLLYDFSLPAHGGIESLARHVKLRRCRLIVIAVLAKVQPAVRGRSEKTYHRRLRHEREQGACRQWEDRRVAHPFRGLSEPGIAGQGHHGLPDHDRGKENQSQVETGGALGSVTRQLVSGHEQGDNL